MKKLVYPLGIILGLLAAGCQREAVKDPASEVEFKSFEISIGQDNGNDSVDPETRSLISIETEDFVDAFLFAFDASTKKVLTYPEYAGDLYGTGPVAIYTTQKNFNWALPINKSMDVWVIVNAGEQFTTFLNGCLSNANLTENNLYGTNMMFTCENGTQLKRLDTQGFGIPMSGQMNGITLASTSSTLSVRVKRLFAKYNIYFDTSALTSQGYVVKSTYLMGSKSNTQVPFFWDGNYQQTDINKLAIVDRSTEEDLIALDGGNQVTLYFLENCQGNKSGASSWRTVYSDLGANAVRLCSYMEVGVNVTRASDGTDESYSYRIYLGNSDMKSNFDVERNLFKTVKLYLKMDNIPPAEYFRFTNSNSISVAPGETTQNIPFETNIDPSSLTFRVQVPAGSSGGPTANDLHKVTEVKNVSSWSEGTTYTGYVAYSAASGANEGTLDLYGGRNLGSQTEIKGKTNVDIQVPTVLDGYNVSTENSSEAGGLTHWYIYNCNDDEVGTYFDVDLSLYKATYSGDITGSLIDRYSDQSLYIPWDDVTFEEFPGVTVNHVKWIRYSFMIHANSHGQSVDGDYAEVSVYDSPTHVVHSFIAEPLDGSFSHGYFQLHANLNIDHIDIYTYFNNLQ